MNKKLLYPLIVLALAIGVAALLILTKPKLQPQSYNPAPPTVRVIAVQKKDEHMVVRSQGSVQPRTQTKLIPEVSGRVVWMSPALVTGGRFSKNEPLLRIDPSDYSSALERSQAIATRTEVERQHAEDELARLQKLHRQKLASQSQLDDAERKFKVAEARMIEARVAQQQARRDLSRTELTAPFTGRVRSEHVDVGQFVSRGSDIATLYADDFVEVRLPIPTSQLGFLEYSTSSHGQLIPKSGSEVTIFGQGRDTTYIWTGQLHRIEAFDTQSRMPYFVTRIKNTPGESQVALLVGMFVQAEIQGRLEQDVIRLPRSALRDDNQVLVIDADNILHFRQVTVLRMEHDEVLIKAGLEDGEQVCISPLQTVVDGMRVIAVEG